MAMMRENLFAIAADAQAGKYSGKRSENLLSGLFCSLMRVDQPVARAVFALLTGESQKGSVEVIAQPKPVSAHGTKRKNPSPDILLNSASRSVLLEVKVASSLSEEQLDDYLKVAVHQSQSTGRRYDVAYIDERTDTKRTLGVQDHGHYLRPTATPHFQWQEIYDLIRSKADEKTLAGRFRGDFADFMRDRMQVARDLRDSYDQLYADQDELRNACRRSFYQRYAGIRQRFSDHASGWMLKPGDRGVEQYAESHFAGTEAFDKIGWKNVVFRWTENATKQPKGWPAKYLKVMVKLEPKATTSSMGPIRDMEPIQAGKHQVRVSRSDSESRREFLFDVLPWIENANLGIGLNEVLAMCADRVIASLDGWGNSP